MPAMMLLITALRSSMVDCDQAGNAALAAFDAASTSSAVPMLMVANASSVAGLITSRVERPVGSTHSPLMKNLLYALVIFLLLSIRLHLRQFSFLIWS